MSAPRRASRAHHAGGVPGHDCVVFDLGHHDAPRPDDALATDVGHDDGPVTDPRIFSDAHAHRSAVLQTNRDIEAFAHVLGPPAEKVDATSDENIAGDVGAAYDASSSNVDMLADDRFVAREHGTKGNLRGLAAR